MALHPQGLPDLRHSCLDLRRAHDAQPRHAAVLVLDERTRLGLVRSTQIEAGMPEVWQTLGVQSHA